MSRSLEQMLNDYDWHALAGLRTQWAQLNDRGRFACLVGTVVSRDYATAESLLARHRDDLQQRSVYWGHRLHLDSELSGDFAKSLHGALYDLGARHQDPYVHGELAVIIGISLVQYESYDLALEFFRDSNKAFAKEGFPTLIWRGDFNIALCHLKMKNYTRFHESVSDLEKRFFSLPEQAQWSLARLFVWLFFHMDENGKAARLTLSIIEQLRPRPERDPRLSYLLKQHLFILARQADLENFLRHFEVYSELLDPGDRATVMGFKEVLETAPATRARATDLIAAWRQSGNIFDLLQQSEILLRAVLAEKKYELLMQAYQDVEKSVLTLKFVMPPADLREFGLLAYRHTQRPGLFKNLFDDYATSAPPWRQKNFSRTLAVLERDKGNRSLRLDLRSGEVTFAGRTLSLARKPKMLAFFHEILLYKRGIAVSPLFERLYPDERVSPEEKKSRLSTLVSRANKALGAPCFGVIQNRVVLATGLTVQLRKGAVYTPRKRHEQILAYAESVPLFSIRDIESSVPIPRRTLQADLMALVKKRKLRKEGAGRAASYQRTRS